MALTLQRFANGDTNYIAKHNANADGVEAAVNGLQTQLATSFGASISIGDALLAIFGGSLALIGSLSYTATTSGSTLNVGPGYLWRPDTGMVQNGAGGALNFAGVAAGTYYVVPDASGAVTRATNSTGATHTVVWSGSSFTSVTRTAAVFLNASDDSAALTSTALAATYANLDARLEAGESVAKSAQTAATSAGTAAAAAQTSANAAQAEIDTAQGSFTSLDARLDALEIGLGGAGSVSSVGLAAPAEFTVSGSPVTANGTLTLTKSAQPVNSVWAGPPNGGSAVPGFRALVVADLAFAGSANGIATLDATAKVPASQLPGVFGGSGISHSTGFVPDPGATAGTTKFLREDGHWAAPAAPTIIYADLPTGIGPGKPRVQVVAYAASVTLDCAAADVFRIALTGNITIDFANGVDGQKVEVRITQDGTGSRAVTWSGNVGYGTDLSSASATPTTTPNKQDKFGFEYDAGASKYHLIALARGF